MEGVEYRHIREDEVEAFYLLSSYAFAYPPSPAGLERSRTLITPDSAWGAFADGELVAKVNVIPFQMRLNGSALPLGGIGGVGCYPEQRRRGHVGRLLRLALAEMRDRGQPLSALYPTFYALYRRYGWELAAEVRRYKVDAADLHPAHTGDASGQVRRCGADDWAALHDVYTRATTRANGPIERHEQWWRQRVLSDPFGGDPMAALWSDDGGRPQAYVLYRLTALEHFGQRCEVRELVAATPQGYVQILRFLAAHDLVRELRWQAPADDPLLSVIADPSRCETRVHGSYMLRVVDAARAVEQRPFDPEMRASLALRIVDPTCDWNDGVWRLEVAEGRGTLTRSRDEPVATLGAPALAALYNGYRTAWDWYNCGRIEATDRGALTALTRAFSAEHAPHCYDFY